MLRKPLDPWERWLVIHGGELLPDGRPRFRKLLVIVARQNGKTFLLVVLSLFWLFVEQVALVLGTSTNLDYAKESWEMAVTFAEENGDLVHELPRDYVRRANGEQVLKIEHRSRDGALVGRSRYKIAASNRKGGRSLTVHRLILDELREHLDWSAWNAAYNAMNAVADGQAWGISNQGDEKAVVLDSLRSEVVDKDGNLRPLDERDTRLGLFEWSAPPNSRADDPFALARANPNMNRHADRGPFLEDLLADARRAIRAGGDELAGFLTEILCVKVPNLDPAISAEGWADGLVPGTLDAYRDRVAMVFDMSLDGQHITLAAAAALPDGKVRGEIVAAWSSAAQMRRELPDLVRRAKPRKLGWLPEGPAATLAAVMKERAGWPPAGVAFEEIRAEVPAVCMGFAELVEARQYLHSGDPLGDAHAAAAEKLRQGDKWRYTRRGAGHVDATYAQAGAVHLARTLPPPPARSQVF